MTEKNPAPSHGVGLVVVDALQAQLSETELLELEIAVSSQLADLTVRRLVPRLVAEVRASRARLTEQARPEPATAPTLKQSALPAVPA